MTGDAPASRPRRRGVLPPRPDGAGRASASASGGSRSSTSTAAGSRSPTRTSTVWIDAERRDLQLRASCAPSSRRAATSSRTNGDAEMLVHLYEERGPRLHRAPERDVRLRRLGRATAAPAARAATGWARSPCTTPSVDGAAALRLGAEGAPPAPGLSARTRPDGARALPRVRVRAFPPLDLLRDPQAAPWPPARLGARKDVRRARTGTSASTAPMLDRKVRSSRSSRSACARPFGSASSATCRWARSSAAASTRARSSPSCATCCRPSRCRRSRSASPSGASTSPSTRGAWREHFRTQHHEQIFTPSVLLDVLPEVTAGLDEPFADPSVLPTFLLSRFARETVTVALGGDGGDELLAGYPTFPAEAVARRYLLPRGVHERDRRAARRPPARLDGRTSASTSSSSASCAVRSSRPRRATSCGSARSRPPSSVRCCVEPPTVDPLAGVRALYGGQRTGDWVAKLIYLYAKTYLPDDILAKIDRASMLTSLEVRAPFLDYTLVEFLARVPSHLKLRRFETKHLLKRADGGPSAGGDRRTQEEGLRDSRRGMAQDRPARAAARRCSHRSGCAARGSSTHARSSA